LQQPAAPQDGLETELAKPLPLHQQTTQEGRTPSDDQGREHNEAKKPPEEPGNGESHPWSVSSDSKAAKTAATQINCTKPDLQHRLFSLLLSPLLASVEILALQ
jgi:hypothetical protein